jgi:hypothetical protein
MVNFFRGFITFEKIKKSTGGKPLRLIRPLVTKERKVVKIEENKKK